MKKDYQEILNFCKEVNFTTRQRAIVPFCSSCKEKFLCAEIALKENVTHGVWAGEVAPDITRYHVIANGGREERERIKKVWQEILKSEQKVRNSFATVEELRRYGNKSKIARVKDKLYIYERVNGGLTWVNKSKKGVKNDSV